VGTGWEVSDAGDREFNLPDWRCACDAVTAPISELAVLVTRSAVIVLFLIEICKIYRMYRQKTTYV